MAVLSGRHDRLRRKGHRLHRWPRPGGFRCQRTELRRHPAQSGADRRGGDTYSRGGAANPRIPWRLVIATRNRLIHGYLGIDNDTLWSIIQGDIPTLLPLLRTLKGTLS
ncbi:MAG: DUF86 domain-containing protein [Burkholderiales bacterium]|nr:DUF86 domain-containing protein [Burkholderiales bacterium]